MKKSPKITRLLSLVLAVVTVGTGLVAFPTTVSAVEDLNAAEKTFDELDGPTWYVNLSGIPSSPESSYTVEEVDYNLVGSKSFLAAIDPVDATRTVYGVTDGSANLRIVDKKMNLTNYGEFTISMDMYFAAFPTGEGLDDSPLSLMSWCYTPAGATEETEIVTVSLNGAGYLCTGVNTLSNVSLPQGKWFNLAVTVVPSEGFFYASLDGLKVLQTTFTAPSGVTGSVLSLFEESFSYSAYVYDIRVSTSNRDHWSISTDSQKVPGNTYVDHGDFSIKSASTLRNYLSPEEGNSRVWDIDLNRLPPNLTQTTTVDCGSYSIYAQSSLDTHTDPTDSTKSVRGINGNGSALRIYDEDMNLTSYGSFTLSMDLYFAAFPSGTSGTKTPDTYSLNLVSWRYVNTSGTVSSITNAGIRIDNQGQICTGTDPSTSGTGNTLPQNTWFTLSITFVPEEGTYTVLINNAFVMKGSYTAQFGDLESVLYVFDGMYQYTTYIRNVQISAEKSSVWGVKNKTDGTRQSTNIFIQDDTNKLVNSAAFTIAADMYFEEFPTGVRTDTGVASTPNDLPMSLLKWQTVSSSGSYIHRALRINSNGVLCVDTNTVIPDVDPLQTGRWYNLSMTICPSSGRYEVYLDGEYIYLGAFAETLTAASSHVIFFDGFFGYTAYIRNPSVTTRDEPDIGITEEASADYFGYQTRDNGDSTFDIRFLSSIDPAAFAATDAGDSDTFSEAGYEITAVWRDASDEVHSSVQRLTTTSVYREINVEDNGVYSLPDGDYIHALSVNKVDKSNKRIEFTVRPYTELRGGGRRYGEATTLLWTPDNEIDPNGNPTLTSISQVSPYRTNPSDDTFVRIWHSDTYGTSTNTSTDRGVNGTRETIQLKYVKDGSHYNRQGYVKFSLNETAIGRIADSQRIVLRMYAEVVPQKTEWTADEIAKGGVMIRVSGCSSEWDETTLSSENNYTVAGDMSNMPDDANADYWDTTILDNHWMTVDVTDYVKACAEAEGADAVSFMLKLTSPTERSTTVQLRSSEYNNAPELLVYPALTNFSADLDKYANEGNEPWAYAEELVERWINEGYPNAYGAADTDLQLNFNKMTSTTDNSDNTNYTITSASNLSIQTLGSEKVLTNNTNSTAGHYYIDDVDLNLTKIDKLFVSADFMFTKFPEGTREGKPSTELPLNLMRWMPTSGSSNCGIRIDVNGNLYTSSATSLNKQVSLKQWFNIRLEYDLTTKKYTIYLDGENIGQGTFSTPNFSRVYILDGYFSYTAHVKNIRVGDCAIPDLQPVENTEANFEAGLLGAYNTPINWRASHMRNQVNSKIYVRSIDSLSKLAENAYNASAVKAPTYDAYGGITNAGFTGEVTRYFHTEIHNGRVFIIDPLGNPYFAVGMNTVELGATENQEKAAIEQFGSEADFYEAVTADFREIGINTVWGGDVEQFLEAGNFGTVRGVSMMSSYMGSLKLTNNNSTEKFKHNNTMNVFDPDFLSYCVNKAQTTITEEAAKDKRILGWTTDNEICDQVFMLYDYLTIDATAPENAFSYAAAWTFLKARTGNPNPSVEDITPALSEEFKAFVYDCYYQVTTAALKEAGVQQMYLGNRIHGNNKSSEGYLRAASQYVDILTVNLYGGPEPPIDTIEYMYKYSRVPIIVTEFYAKAQDTVDMNGIPLMNQTNAGWVVETQEDRAAHYENYVMLLLESRCCVGWTWYRFRDNDQRVYGDTAGNIYVDYDISAGKISGYVKVGTYTKNEDNTYTLEIDPEIQKIAGYTVGENGELVKGTGYTDLSIALNPYLGQYFADEDGNLVKDGDKYATRDSFVTYSVEGLFTIHEGEYGGDNSNNGSNKGLYDNNMNIYQPLADAYKRVDGHIMGLVNYFDALHGIASAAE